MENNRIPKQNKKQKQTKCPTNQKNIEYEEDFEIKLNRSISRPNSCQIMMIKL